MSEIIKKYKGDVDTGGERKRRLRIINPCLTGVRQYQQTLIQEEQHQKGFATTPARNAGVLFYGGCELFLVVFEWNNLHRSLWFCFKFCCIALVWIMSSVIRFAGEHLRALIVTNNLSQILQK
ncbi:MAG: hypothetical protein D6B27_10165 [Gammaproteobacteria bacterium]|nr:MAG: hypothetical protein D6B27_10165 [Gammaproteobacteria bacterium]